MNGTRGPWLVLLVLCLGQSLSLLDATVVNAAVPTIIDDTGASIDQVLWVINGYTLTYAALLVTGGRLGDLYGQKRMVVYGIGAFVVASALCGFAQNPTQLIAARLCQGVASAMLTPQMLAILPRIFPPERRGLAYGINGVFQGVTIIIGPSLGGVIVSQLGWRWVFFINVPIGLATMVLSWLVIPELRGGKRLRLDVVGTVVLTAALALLVTGLIEGPPRAWGQVWGPVSVPLLLTAGAVLLVMFAFVERARQDRAPLIPFAVVRQWNFTLMSIVSAAIQATFVAYLLLVTIHLQSGFGMSAYAAGLVLAVTPLAVVTCAPLGGWLTGRYGGKYPLIAGFLLWATGLGLLATQARADSSWPDVLPGLLIGGIGMGFIFSPPATIAMGEIEPAMSGAASGVLNMSRLVGGLLGVAAIGAVLQARLTGSLAEAATRHATALPEPARASFTQAFTGLDPPDLSATPAFAQLPRGLVDGLAQASFHEGVTAAVRFTYLLPIGVVLAAALGTLTMRTRRTEEARPARAEEPTPAS